MVSLSACRMGGISKGAGFSVLRGEKEEEGGDAPKEMGKKEVSQSLVERKYPILLMCAFLHVGLLCDHTTDHRLRQW